MSESRRTEMHDGRTRRAGEEGRELVRLLLDNVSRHEPAAEQQRNADLVERLERLGESCRAHEKRQPGREGEEGTVRRGRGRTAVPQLVPRLAHDVAELDVEVGVVHGGLEDGAEELLGERDVARGEDVGEGRLERATLRREELVSLTIGRAERGREEREGRTT